MDTAINNAYKTISRGRFILPDQRVIQLWFPQLDTMYEQTLSAGTNYYNYPTDCTEVQQVAYEYQSGYYRALLVRSWYNFIDLDTNHSGTPTWWARRERKIYLTPWPNVTGRILRIYYYKNPTALVGSTETPVLPDAYHLPIAILAAYDLAVQYHDENQEKMMQEFLLRLQQLQSDDQMTVVDAFNRQYPVV
jgi:hypothetical protein